MFFYIFVHLLLNDNSEPDCQCPHQPEQRSQQEHKLILFSVATSLEAISTRVGPDIRFGRISGHFQYPAGYRILKLSGYRISCWFLMPDIRLFGQKSILLFFCPSTSIRIEKHLEARGASYSKNTNVYKIGLWLLYGISFS